MIRLPDRHNVLPNSFVQNHFSHKKVPQIVSALSLSCSIVDTSDFSTAVDIV